jgi:hypothetical protein
MMSAHYIWPEHVNFIGFSEDKTTLFKSVNRDLDLHDSFICTLFQNLDFPFYLSVRVDDPKWEILSDSDDGVWDEDNLNWFESMIEDDFGQDDLNVQLTRMFDEGWPRSTSAIWKIEKK